MAKNKVSGFSFIGYILFFIPLSILVGFAVMLSHSLFERGVEVVWVAVILLGFIAVMTLLFCLIDIIRRRVMIDRPVEQILNATNKISEGNFNVKLLPLKPYNKYDEYDLIMENINKMTEALSKSEILKKEFISNVSHEIKTPLALIQNYAKALLSQKLEEETRKKYLSILVKNSEKLSNLVSNILKLNKLENQTRLKELENVNIGELLRESILQFEDIVDKKNIDLNCSIADVKMDIQPGYAEIIFNNLISNAIKFSNNGGKVDIELNLKGENIVFKIKDYGLGMSKEVGSRIFEKFYQGDTSHSGEGNGLGLALVKRVIDNIGGQIQVESAEGKGSTFIVMFKREENE